MVTQERPLRRGWTTGACAAAAAKAAYAALLTGEFPDPVEVDAATRRSAILRARAYAQRAKARRPPASSRTPATIPT